MSKRVITEELFLKDIASHQMTVIRDDGLYRHIRFKKPNTTDMFFDIITWPMHLCYTGDMGTFVFSRIEDMFQFFRTDRRQAPGNIGNQQLYVNTGYWGEKCIAVDSCDGMREYSVDRFREVIQDWLETHLEDEEDEAFCNALRQAVDDEILSYCGDKGEEGARQLVGDFEFKYDEDGDDERTVTIDDFWERSLTVKTPRYVWCCYALAWGIAQYDQWKEIRKMENGF